MKPIEESRVKRRLEQFLARSPRGRGPRVVVLCYHSVHPTKAMASATPGVFEQQVAWLREHCDVVPYESIPELLASPDRRRPAVAVTFDDGYEDNYAYALPILRAHGILPTIFLTTGLIDGDPAMIRRFGRLWRASEDDVRALSWTQVAEMRAVGVKFGAHTLSHPDLAHMTESDASEEIRRSKAVLEDHLQEEIRAFAYPFGRPRYHVSDRTKALVASAGFGSAATITYRGVKPRDAPWSIPRFPVTGDSMQVFAGKIHGRLELIGLWQEHAPLSVSRLISTDPAR